MTALAAAPVALFEHENSLRLFGPAGSGKTRELVRILQEHVADGDFLLIEGIIVSFTRAAAHDIARRVNPDGEPGKYHCTLHALCKRYYGFDGEIADTKLKEFFGERLIPYTPGRSPDPEEWATSADAPKSEGALLIAFWNLCRNRLLTIEEGMNLFTPQPEIAHWWAGDRMTRLWREYCAWKDEHRLFDFTDMLEWAVNNPPTGEQWAFFVLDEAQDSTPLQWAVAHAFARASKIAYIAGDDDQAIYTWAGATPVEFLRARISLDDVLRVNYRSGQAIVDEAQRFIRRNRERRDKGTTAARGGGSIRHSPFIPELSLNESSFVMARAHYLNNDIMDELTARGMPFVDKRGKYGVAGASSTAYQRFLRLQKGHALTLDEYRLLLNVVPANGPWLTRGTKKRLNEMDKEFRANTYIRLRDLANYGATEAFLGAISGGMTDPLERLDKERLRYLREVEQRHGQEYLDERKAAAVCQVGPIHAFKGLECDHAVIHSGMPPAATREAMSDPEPERRVFYVGITRAKERVTYYDGLTYVPARWGELL